MGEDRAEFSRRQKMLAEKRDQAAVQGQDTSLVESGMRNFTFVYSIHSLCQMYQIVLSDD